MKTCFPPPPPPPGDVYSRAAAVPHIGLPFGGRLRIMKALY